MKFLSIFMACVFSASFAFAEGNDVLIRYKNKADTDKMIELRCDGSDCSQVQYFYVFPKTWSEGPTEFSLTEPMSFDELKEAIKKVKPGFEYNSATASIISGIASGSGGSYIDLTPLMVMMLPGAVLFDIVATPIQIGANVVKACKDFVCKIGAKKDVKKAEQNAEESKAATEAKISEKKFEELRRFLDELK